MHFTNLIKFSYWLSFFTPKFSTTALLIALVILALVFVAGIVMRVVAAKKKDNPPFAQGLRRLSRPLFFVSLLELGLVGCRQLGAAVLSSRLLMALVFAIAIAWFVVSLRNFLRVYGEQYRKLLETRKYQAYLPKKK